VVDIVSIQKVILKKPEEGGYGHPVERELWIKVSENLKNNKGGLKRYSKC